MPTYDYACEVCGNEEELEHSIKDEPEIKCSKCNAVMKRCISKTSFILQGGGWAKDNYKGS